MIEQQVLKYVSEREAFTKYRDIVKDCLITKEAKEMLKHMESYYIGFPKEDRIVFSELYSWNLLKNPIMKEEKKELLETLCTNLDDMDVKDVDENVISIITQRAIAGDLVIVCDEIAQGQRENFQDIYDVLEQHDTISRSANDIDDCEVAATTYDLFDPSTVTGGYEWRLSALNQSLGPLTPGSLILFSSRPDSGKTSMLASEATYIADQLPDEKRVLWLCNEEMGELIKKRIVTSALNLNIAAIQASRAALKAELDKLERQFKVLHVPGKNIKQLEIYIKEFNPGLIIVDQLRKIGSPWDKEMEYLRLQKLFEWARLMAQKYAPILAVHQADGSADGMKYLTMNQIHGSNTDVQGEVDALIMIGKSHDPSEEFTRGLSIPKNKMGGGDPSMRNANYEILIDRDVGRFSMPKGVL